MKNWYKSAPLKGVLLVIQHVLVVLAAISLIWLATYPGITQDILSQKDIKNYEETEGFGIQVFSDSQLYICFWKQKSWKPMVRLMKIKL